MKLLILSQYFPPETGAPQNRLYELALQLKNRGVEITILTAMPNYPKMEIFPDYKGKEYIEEEMDGMTVHRTKIYVTKSKSISKRLMNYFSFVSSSYRFGKTLGDFDYILCESPPLFLGYSAMKLSRRLNAKLIFNVSDLWPESAEKLGLVSNKIFLKMAYRLEARCYKRSVLVTGQTQGIVKDIKERFPDKDVYWLPNGVDMERYVPEKVKSYGFREKYDISATDIIFFYGGVLGHAQGLEVIVKAAARLKDVTNVKFVIMGSGPLREDLIELSNSLQANNVVFADPVARTEIGGVIKEIDVSLIPLRNLPLFLGAIPSKIFEILAMEKPILLGVKGEAKELFINEGKSGWSFEPEDVDDLLVKINEIIQQPEIMKEFGLNGRKYVGEKFNREIIASDFYDKLLILDKNS
jgi:glycosyltransferase involved in cell wall biosynthesis